MVGSVIVGGIEFTIVVYHVSYTKLFGIQPHAIWREQMFAETLFCIVASGIVYIISLV